MFYTPKPRQFHYSPRFYDPEKEEWERLKQKYAFRKEQEAKQAAAPADEAPADTELAYFERRVRELDSQERQQKARFSFKDIFRKREMPTFNYKPRFQEGREAAATSPATGTAYKRIKFSRRFDVEDPESFKPVPAGKIFIYIGLVLLLLYWILA